MINKTTNANAIEQPKVALIVGASGLIGQHLLTQLLASSSYSKVIALVRKPLTFTHPKLITWQVDFQQLTAELSAQTTGQFHVTTGLSGNNLPAIDDIFCTLGSTIKKAGSKAAFTEVDYHYPLIIAEHFYRQHSSLFAIVTAMAANESSNLFYNQVKGKVETSLRKIGYQHLGIFRPSMLSGQRDENRIGEQVGAILMHALAFIIPKKYQVIQAEKVANAMLAYANNPQLGVSIIQSNQLQNH